jgi:hypothetical protein
MKNATELSKISDEFVGKFVNDMKQYQHDVITTSLANISDNEKLARCVKIKYLTPTIDGSIRDYKVESDVSAYIDVRRMSGSDIRELRIIAEETLNELRFKVSFCMDIIGVPIMVISW